MGPRTGGTSNGTVIFTPLGNHWFRRPPPDWISHTMSCSRFGPGRPRLPSPSPFHHLPRCSGRQEASCAGPIFLPFGGASIPGVFPTSRKSGRPGPLLRPALFRQAASPRVRSGFPQRSPREPIGTGSAPLGSWGLPLLYITRLPRGGSAEARGRRIALAAAAVPGYSPARAGQWKRLFMDGA
jgi:hypothetical protein